MKLLSKESMNSVKKNVKDKVKPNVENHSLWKYLDGKKGEILASLVWEETFQLRVRRFEDIENQAVLELWLEENGLDMETWCTVVIEEGFSVRRRGGK